MGFALGEYRRKIWKRAFRIIQQNDPEPDMANDLKLDLTAKDRKQLDALLKKLKEQNPELDFEIKWIEDGDEEEE